VEDCLALEGDLKGSENIWKNISPDLNTWENLHSGKPDTFSVGGIKVWVKVGFACPEDDLIQIIDCKTGNSKGKPDPIQLNIYGYYASKVWGISEEKILNSVEHMKEMLMDKDANEVQEEDFPKIENNNFCRHFRYRRVCKPELVS